MIYAYVRVSTAEQNEARQIVALCGLDIQEANVFLDKQSGKNFDRPQYQRLVKKLRPGDLLIVKSIDRLGRSYKEILEQWRHITKEIGADIRVLDMPLLDTSSSRDLTGTLIADIVLQLLSYVAQTERENIRQRQAEGIAAARARGVRFGRSRAQIPEGFADMAEQWERGWVSATVAANELGMSRDTFLRRVRESSAGSPKMKK